MPENASNDWEGWEDLADAVRCLAKATCCLAVKLEARNPSEQRELAAIMWSDVLGDFREVPTTEEMRTWMAGLMKIDPGSLTKKPYGQ